ncbi:uncharacterized protein UTRI_04628 [Ustilago trichophora]|uniref:Subtelomeric hrmA-associated cluster protein AFUB-079030/YDR124W-like helical bundle domain-containing protein n=1 Tax=Ustilago trichophora TaxID=86804 RepID=A0A5C3EEU6_9BASI|nr:uncharacterized protein UTRI_04628 [Ustilago trichophora]
MPRIPVRVEPYSSPSRQHRHYKNKRDQVLRALGKAAYINGSHFAIMWVSARGDVETYASEALQSRLDDWFVKGGIAEEAKQLVKNTAGGCGNANGGAKVFEDLLSDDNDDDDDAVNGGGGGGGGETEVDDVFTDSNGGGGGNKENDKEGGRMMAGGGKAKRGPLAPLNTAIANQHFLRSRSSFGGMMGDDIMAPKSAPLFPTSSASGFGDDGAPRTSTPLVNTSSRLLSRNSLSSSSSGTNFALTTNSSTAPTIEITLANQAARTAFLELRFGQLQQGVCKTVAKAWIKIIEPKKQTRCPYNKGEAGKPDWWPAGVRHKEPDHLMKPERHALLLTILRSPKVQVARLQLATAEVVALIKADKVSLLMDVYRIAREEEKLREKGEENKDQVVKVAVSTLDGWCSEQNGMTVAGRQIARSATPEMVAEKKSNAKRAASLHMTKSNSTSGLANGGTGPNKRRSIASTNSRSAEVKSRPLPAFLDPLHHQPHHHHHPYQHHQQQQQQQHENMIGLGLMAPGIQPRSQSFSAPSTRSLSFPTQPTTATNTATNSTDASPLNSSSCWPNTTNSYNFAEVNGLVTPLTGTSGIDPAFHTDLPPQPPHPHSTSQPFPTSADLNAFSFYPPTHPHQPSFYPPPPHNPTHTHTHTPIFDNALGLTVTQAWNFSNLDMSNSSMDLSTCSSTSWQNPAETTTTTTTTTTASMGETSFSLDDDSIDPPPRTPSPGTIDSNLRLNLAHSKMSNLESNLDHHHHHLWLNSQHQQTHQAWQQDQQFTSLPETT